MLNASSARMSHALEQTNVARIRVICQSASSARHFLLARGQLSTCFPSSLSRIHLVACLYLCPADCFQEILFQQAVTSRSNKLGFLTSVDVNNKATGMLTSNAKRIFCENVTCFGTNKCCSNKSHLPECFKCSSLLACKGTAFNLFSK